MVDVFDAQTRSWIMSQIRSKDTKPEMAVRRLAFRLGYRYRLHDRKLPGTPDLVFPARHKVIFVNGCFWHGHGCHLASGRPKTNTTYWNQKIDRNQERDASNATRLKAEGWRVLVIWECQLKNTERTISRLQRFLG
jgi:DNA mismatch endonuclease (patch repair protein)